MGLQNAFGDLALDQSIQNLITAVNALGTLLTAINNKTTAVDTSHTVVTGVSGALPVTGTFWQTTQPVSGTFWQATQPISAVSLPLPAGAATAAKQPTLGTAGTPSSDVLTVQGVASMTALKVDGSAVTQPVSGTFWQATQPVSLTSVPLPTGAATEATLAAVNTKLGGTLSVTAAGAATSAKQDTGNTSLASIDSKLGGTLAVSGPVTDAQMRATPIPVSGTFWQAVQPVSGTFWQAVQPVSATSLPLPTGAAQDSTVSAITAAITAMTALVQEVDDSCDMLTEAIQSLVARMPRVDATSRQVVYLESSNAASTNLHVGGYGSAVNSVSHQSGGVPYSTQDAGSVRHYSQLTFDPS